MDSSRKNSFGGSGSDERNPSVGGVQPNLGLQPDIGAQSNTESQLTSSPQLVQPSSSTQPISVRPTPTKQILQQITQQSAQSQPIDGTMTSINSGVMHPVSRGTVNYLGMDNVVFSGVEKKKSRKYFVIMIIVGSLLIIGLLAGVLGWWLNSDSTVRDVEFHEVLDENYSDAVDYLLFVESVYDGNMTLKDFYDQPSGTTQWLDGRMMALSNIYNRLQDGPALYGTRNMIDLGANYASLKKKLENNMGGYERFSELTKLLLGLSEDNTEVVVDGLEELGLRELSDRIETYNNDLAVIVKEYRDNGCGDDSGVCGELMDRYDTLRASIDEADVIQRAYMSIASELGEDEEESVLYYINNLYIATEESNE